MKRTLENIQGEAIETIQHFKKRNDMYKEMDAMASSDWSLPDDIEVKEFMRETVSPAPANALETSVKVLGAERPNIKFTPTGGDPVDRMKANNIERALTWELTNAAKRSQTKLVPDVIRSALQYGEVAVYVDYIPWMMEGQKLSRRKERIMRSGNFALTPHNPMTVYPKYSPYGLESVLLAKPMSAIELVRYWGERANGLKEYILDKHNGNDFTIYYFDYVDDWQRDVWVAIGADPKDDKFTFLDEERDRAFIPWAIRMTGTALVDKPELQRIPFLSTVYRANMWRTMNLIQTLITSEVLSYAAAPRAVIEGMAGEEVTVEYGEPNKPVRPPYGTTYNPINPPVIDRALTEIFDRIKADLDAATSVQVLQNLNFPAGTAYATINAVLQTAIASLQPYKVLAEMALVDMFETMLLWVDEAEGTIGGRETDSKSDRYGSQYTVRKDDFSVNAIYLECNLNASAPTDFMQRINAGTLMYQLGYPKARVFEDLNVADPQQVVKERTQEDFVSNEIGILMNQRNAEAQMQIQMMQQQVMQMLQAAQPQPGGGGVPPIGQAPQGAPPSPGFENVEGQGFDPNMGGEPPSTAASGLTREELTGLTQGGEPLAEL